MIELRQNHSMLNFYNSVLKVLVTVNTNMSFLLTTVKMLALLFYMINYATKNDLTLKQILVQCALLKMNVKKQHVISYKCIQALSDVSNNFILCCVNILAHNTKVSNVQMIHNLLNYENCF